MSSNLSVADVYDIAANIGKLNFTRLSRPPRSFFMVITGKEFEVLIDSHGPEHVTPLMQKVISALEDLEKLALVRYPSYDGMEIYLKIARTLGLLPKIFKY